MIEAGEFDGKVALVTGAGGLASSLECLDDDHPATTARAGKNVGFLGIGLCWWVGLGAMGGYGQ